MLAQKINSGSTAQMGKPSGLKLGDCTVAEITRAAGQLDHLETSPLRRRDGTCAIQRDQPGSTPGHDSRLYRSDTSMVFNGVRKALSIPAKDTLLPHSSIFFACTIGLLKINTSSNS